MDALFDALVVQGRKEGIIGTEEVAIDSTEIDAYEKAKPKKELPIDAQSAAWGSKRDTHGNQKAWFGYKTHLACDCKSELPVAIEVTPANVHDSKLAVPLMPYHKCCSTDQSKSKADVAKVMERLFRNQQVCNS